MSARAQHVIVLGGGTAGWMAACLIAHRWNASGTTVTVVESPDIGIIGVGEGSTPQLKAMFDVLGIAEPKERDAATLACLVWCMQQGANIFRVHNVAAASQVVRLF